MSTGIDFRRCKMSKKVRVGIIGFGGIGKTHLRYLQPVENAEVIAAADINEENLKSAREEFGIKYTFKNWNEMLKLKELDAVCVCTPNKLHYKPTIDALNAGKHVLVEKPMAMNAKESAKMVETAKKKKKILQIAFQWRFTPNAQFLKRQFDEGVFGNVCYVRVQALRRRGIPNWGVFGRKELQGGGPMIDIGVHLLEMAHYIVGSPKPVSARGACYTYIGNKKSEVVCPWPNWDYKTYTVEDLAVGFLTFENGMTLAIESSFAAHIEKDTYNVQIFGTKGGATFEPARVYTDMNGYMMNIEPGYLPAGDNWFQYGFEYKMRHFIECIADGKKCLAPGEDGLVVQQMLDAIYLSAEKGKEIKIKSF